MKLNPYSKAETSRALLRKPGATERPMRKPSTTGPRT